jgi:hypothetical protein
MSTDHPDDMRPWMVDVDQAEDDDQDDDELRPCPRVREGRGSPGRTSPCGR